MAWDRDHLKGLNPAKALAVKLVSPVEAAIAAIVHGHRPGWVSGGSTPNNQFPVAAALNFGDVSLNLGIVKSAADLLAGATDADGDALTVTTVTVGVGCTVTGTGPWTITPTSTGAGTANATISDGRGGTVVRVLSWTCFNHGLWNHAAATASGGSQILGVNRYRIYSSAGAISQVTVPAALVAGRAYQFQLTFETPVLGTQLQVGDAGANLDDFVSSLAGTRTVAFVADGTVATIKRPYVVSAGQPTDVVVKNVAITDITATALAITSQPQARSIVAGNTTTFSVTVAAPFSAIHYSWEVSTNGGSTWATYVGGTGATTNTLTTAAMALGDNGELFRCRIRMGSATNTIGQIYSNAATLTVTAANANPVSPTLALGDLTVGTGLVQSSTDLLAGATDADGDTLTITSVTAVGGGTVSGTGPWTITPSATGAGSATVVISDGRGGTVNRTVTWNGVAAPAAFTFDLRPTAAMTLDSGVPAGAVAAGMTASVTGGVITVTAATSAFAAGGLPQYLIYDNGSGKTPGTPVSLSATIGTWSAIQTDAVTPVYHAGGVGGRPFVCDWHGPNGERTMRQFNFPTPVTEAFVAKALRFPQFWTGSNDNGPAWDVEEHYIPRDSTIKTDWGRYIKDGGDPSTDVIFGSHTQADTLAMGGNSVPFILGIGLTPLVAFNRWMEFRGWIKDNPINHALSSASLRLSSPRGVKETRSSAVTVLSPNGIGYAPLNLMLTGAWLDENPLAIVQRAYSYVAGGTNAPCRIEIGNRPVYSECEFIHPCPPSAWSGTSVSALFDRGQIPPGAPCYAYVMLADDLPAGGGIGTLVEGA